MSDKTICTCGQGYDPECPWEGHHQQDPVRRYGEEWRRGLLAMRKADLANAFEICLKDKDRDIKALEYRLDVLTNSPNNEAALLVSDATEKIAEQAKTIIQLEGETVTLTKQRDAQRVLCTAGIKQQGIMRERIDHLEDEIYAALKATP